MRACLLQHLLGLQLMSLAEQGGVGQAVLRQKVQCCCQALLLLLLSDQSQTLACWGLQQLQVYLLQYCWHVCCWGLQL